MKNHFKSSFDIFTLFALLASLLGSAVFVTPVHAAGIVVNSNADTIADDGTCTLREAINNANSDSQLYLSAGECAMGAGTDTITFDANYTITLDGSQLPAVTSEITINGNGASNTIIQASTCNPVTLPSGCTPAHYRVFEVGSAGNLSLVGITARHGQCDDVCATNILSGGGIYNNGRVIITNSTISNNYSISGGGIYNQIGSNLELTNSLIANNSGNYGGGIQNTTGGAVTIKNSTFQQNSAVYTEGIGGGGGGAIQNSGDLTIENSTFTGNSATAGGGIYSYIPDTITVNIKDSTFDNNSAIQPAGGISYVEGGGVFFTGGILMLTGSTFSTNSSSGYGGGISTYNSNVTVVNSTFSGNTANTYGGGIYSNWWGDLVVVNSTLSGNSANNEGGGIYNGGLGDYIRLYNTIVANSTNGGDCVFYAPLYADSKNIDTDGSCDSATQRTSNEIKLGTLTNNGGPTKTIALLSGSVAISAGDNVVCSTPIGILTPGAGGVDQRGTTRPQGNACDVGAFESSESGGTPTFSDVPFDHPLHDYIEALYQAGYTAGCSTDPLMYCPDTILDRAQSAVFMLRGQMGSTYSPPPAPWDTFGDDWTGFEWAEPWAEGMWQEGLTAGCQPSPLMYCPATQLPRVEASVFGLRMKYGVNYTPPAGTGTLFADMTDTSYWGIGWAEQAYRDGLLPDCGTDSGTGKPLFCPSELLDRAWGAYLIVKAKDIPLP